MRLIDADALKSALEIEQYNDYDDLLRTERLIDNAQTIKAFTLADIEEQYRKGMEKGLEEARPHGEWKPKQMLVGGNGAIFMHNGYECKCGRVVTQRENFCPECGAKMTGER